MKENPVVEIARYFQIARQRVYHLISRFKDEGEYPALTRSGRKPLPIDERTAGWSSKRYRVTNAGPTHREKKIEETYGIHIPHNRIYRVLLNRGLLEITMKKWIDM